MEHPNLDRFDPSDLDRIDAMRVEAERYARANGCCASCEHSRRLDRRKAEGRVEKAFGIVERETVTVATDARYSGPAILAMARRAAMEAVPCTVCTLGVVDPDGTAHWEDLAEVEPSGWCECWEPVRA